MREEQEAWIRTDLRRVLSSLREACIPAFAILGNGDVSACYPEWLALEAAGLLTMVDYRRVVLGTQGGVMYELVGFPLCPFSFSTLKDAEAHDTTLDAAIFAGRGRELAAAPGAASGFLPVEVAMALDRAGHGESYHGHRGYAVMHSCDQLTPEAVAGMEAARSEAVAAGGAASDGFAALGLGWRAVDYAPSRALSHSLEVFLRAPVFREAAEAPVGGAAGGAGGSATRTVLMTHSPPFGTTADMIEQPGREGAAAGREAAPCRWCEAAGLAHLAKRSVAVPHMHVGSVALTRFIREARPWVTVSGHIHHTTDAAGTCIQVIPGAAGGPPTHVVASGNDPRYTEDPATGDRDPDPSPEGGRVRVVLIDLARPADALHMELL